MTAAIGVERVSTAAGSHIEPPLDPRWPKLGKLRWWAAVTALDSGVSVQVEPSNYTRDGRRRRGFFDVSIGGTANGPMSFDEAWHFLNGVLAGARAQRAKRP